VPPERWRGPTIAGEPRRLRAGDRRLGNTDFASILERARGVVATDSGGFAGSPTGS
jgi:hypothetical protein